MEKKKISELFDFLPKSKLKASEGQDIGGYAFYTCSDTLSKYIDVASFEPNKLIFGTGGSPSLHYATEPFSTSTDCFVLSPKESFNCKFIYYFLRQNWHILKQGFKGAGLKHISKEYISNIEILIPSLEEQEKIVARLDKANEIRDKKIKANKKLDELIKSQFVHMFGDPVKNDKNYNLHKLEDVTIFITDGKHGDCVDCDNSGYYFVSAKCINNGKIDLKQARQITFTDYQEVNKRVKINIGDILIVNTGATIGKMAIIKNPEYENCLTLQKSVAVINIDKNKLISEYLFSCLQQKTIANISAGSAIRNLLLSTMRAYQLPVPPLELQQQFAEFSKKIEEQKSKNEVVIQKMTDLINSIMQKEFIN